MRLLSLVLLWISLITYMPAQADPRSCMQFLTENFLVKKVFRGFIQRKSQSRWNEISENTTKIFQTNLDSGFYPQTPLSSPHIHTTHQIAVDQLDKSRLKALPLQRIIENINSAIDSHVASGVVNEFEVLRPVFVFTDSRTGSFQFKKFGDAIREETLVKEVLPTSYYFKLLASGHFPVGDGSLFDRSRTLSKFEHDLAHMTAFIENPKYMAQLRLLANRMYQPGAHLHRLDLLSKESLTPYYYFSEGLLQLRPENRLLLFDQLLLPQGFNLDHGQLNELISFLSTFPTKTLIQQLDHLIQNYGLYFTAMGGAARDQIHGLAEFHDPLKHILYQVKPLFRSILNNEDRADLQKLQHELIVKALARAQMIILWMDKIPIDAWFEASLERQAPVGGLIHQFICLEDIFDNRGSQNLKSMFCK